MVNGTVIAYCITGCSKSTTHLMTKRGPICKDCLAKDSRGTISKRLAKVYKCVKCGGRRCEKRNEICEACSQYDFELAEGRR